MKHEQYRKAFDEIPFSADFSQRTAELLRQRARELEKENHAMHLNKTKKLAVLTAAAAALLALPLAANLEAALVYLFFGWYPMLRPRIAALPSRPLRVLARIAVCSAAALLLYGLVLRLMGLTAELLESAWYFNAALLAAEGFGDLIFVNQAETPERLSEAERLAALLDRPVFAGSLKGGIWKCLS